MTKSLSGWKFIFAAVAAALFIILAPQAELSVHAAPASGIDVSGFQGTINWVQVKQSGVQFAMVRCGNSVYGLDSKFAYNMAAANAVGIRTGVYCYTYAMNAAQAMVDAQLIVSACAPYTVSFPIAIDLEDSCHLSLTPQQQADIVNAFCAVIYNAGYTPMVYTSADWFQKKMGPVMWDHWVASYGDTCAYPGAYTMWQYSDSGTVSGISGNVDQDYLIYDYFSRIKANGFDVRGGKTYYYSNYKRVIGLQTIAGKLYFFDGLGAMATGWLGTGTAKYYFDPADGGAAAFGWKTIEGARYYFGANGLVSVGLTNIGGLNYFFGADGAQVTGLVTAADGSTFYYGESDGSMSVGWRQIAGGWFFFGADGKLITNSIFTDNAGVQVQVNEQGLLVAPAGYTPQ
ncbi:MAG: hypothetical protein LKJ76_01390 [Lachnospiraceae bacterium]|nr:hypothetical protein [Lachnospiraceae bacterium]